MNNIIKKLLAFALLTVSSASLTALSQQLADSATPYNEHYRNQYHFSVSHGWISDPCGLLYYEGKYHCYWWGCAESPDLVHFTEINRRSQMDVPKGQQCWTGCVIADVNNTSGFGAGSYISCLTHHNDSAKLQTQGLAISNDHGQTFSYYQGNPVLDIGYQDFRDPTVFWHEETQQWIMVVSKTLESKAAFYASHDLKEWTWLSDFGPAGRTYRCFECPDFFKLKVEGEDTEKWVLVVSVDWDNEQYFVGDFDGKEFHAEGLQPETGLYVDRASDFYASRTTRDFDGALDGEVYSIGWMNNWTYCRLLPNNYGHQGFWSVPRRLSLISTSEGYRLAQHPKEELTSLRGTQMSYQGKLKAGVTPISEMSALGNTYEVEVTFDCEGSHSFGMNLCVGSGRKAVVTYHTDSHSLTVDRTQVADLHMEKFERTFHAKVAPKEGKLKLRIFVDKCSIEIFSEDGADVFSLATFAGDDQNGFEFFALDNDIQYQMNVWPMQSIWNQSSIAGWAQGKGVFTTDKSKLIDAEGQQFVIRGMNNPHAWFGEKAYIALDDIQAVGCNTIRIVWNTKGKDSDLERIIKRCIELEMIPMVELHDVTGNTSGERLAEMASWYAEQERAKMLQKYERFLLLNIANEWGAHKTKSDYWMSSYAQCIDIMRKAGYTTTLVIDAPGWGQNMNPIVEHGQELIDHDPQHNILFSIHMYGSWNKAKRIKEKLMLCYQKELPLIVGEFGYNHKNGINNLGCKVDYTVILNTCNELDYGYMPWSWTGNNKENQWLDLVEPSDWKTFTWWGQQVIAGEGGITETAKKASVFSIDQ